MGEIAKRFDDIQARSDWAQLSKDIYQANKDVIDRDVSLELSQWSEGVFFNSGMFAGQVGKVFLDNAPASQVMSETTRDMNAPTYFMEGYYGAFTGVWDQTYLEECFVQNQELTDNLYDAMEAYIREDPKTGEQKMAATKPLFKTALASCRGYNTGIERWS